MLCSSCLTRSLDPLDGERLSKAPPPPIQASVGARLAASGFKRAAIEVDPAAPQATQARDRGDIAELHATTTTEANRARRAAAELRARQVARIGGGRLDPSIVAHLPDRSHVPFRAHL